MTTDVILQGSGFTLPSDDVREHSTTAIEKAQECVTYGDKLKNELGFFAKREVGQNLDKIKKEAALKVIKVQMDAAVDVSIAAIGIQHTQIKLALAANAVNGHSAIANQILARTAVSQEKLVQIGMQGISRGDVARRGIESTIDKQIEDGTLSAQVASERKEILNILTTRAQNNHLAATQRTMAVIDELGKQATNHLLKNS